MHVRLLAAFSIALGAVPALATTIDARALARFDQSYVYCESKFPELTGKRDEAYLSLWRQSADKKALAELAGARKSAAYLSERTLIQKNKAKGVSAPASSPIEHQCQAVLAELQKTRKTKP